MKLFRTGLSTGSCAAAAAKAAARLLVSGRIEPEVEIPLPDGSRESLPVLSARMLGHEAEAVVVKDGGDDPDATHRCRIIARVRRSEGENGMSFSAGEGVGTVTRPGLSVAPGEPAINPVPRQMIADAIREITPGAMMVTIAVPDGAAIAQQTFNPRLGIVGGISILGTSGRVRPFSTPAMREALRCLLQVARANGIWAPALVPGRIGARAANRWFRLQELQLIEVGNEWGFALDTVKELGFTRLLLVGHPGKLGKLAEGCLDTHSSRSASALPTLLEQAKAVAVRPVERANTVEGIFRALPAPERIALAEKCAAGIASAVSARFAFDVDVAVALVDMEGNLLGSNGELAPWR